MEKQMTLTEARAENFQKLSMKCRTQTTHVVVNFALNAVESNPDDNMIIELAVADNARYIVTGDKKHLLPLGRYRGIEIVAPATFLPVYKEAS